MGDGVVHHRGNRFFDFMHTGIAVFINPATGGADNVIVLFAQECLLVLGDIFSKLVLDYQSALQQQLHCIV